MRNRIWRAMALTALLSVLAFGVLSMGVLYRFFAARTAAALDSDLGIISAALEGGAGVEALARANADARVTLVLADGTVLFDSRERASDMGNHLDRPEIRDALETGSGASVRRSDTLGEQTIYRARRLRDGSVLRVSGTQKSVLGLLLQILPLFLFLIVVTGSLSALLSRRTTARIVKPLNELNLESPLDNDVYEELSPLLTRMHVQNARIQGYISEQTAQRREFAEITRGMAEALVLLNARGEVLFVNRAAEELLGTSREQGEGRYLLALTRNFQIASAMEGALAGAGTEKDTEIAGRRCRVAANPVRAGDAVTGAVMLIHDVTDRFLAEKARREFTANVSHELKTPLTAILGYAEIMQNGVAAEDMLREFAARIHEEATRLIGLVEDILKLSRLDENRLPNDRRPVSLRELGVQAAARLKPEADRRGVSIAVEGGDCPVVGSQSVLSELVGNLLDNAVKYNRPAGRAVVRLSEFPGGARELVVEDTGIGISPEDQEHVFERFFRADRSRSDEGGTGLGLSIVKHAALAHGASVRLESEPGVGTRVTVRFPAKD